MVSSGIRVAVFYLFKRFEENCYEVIKTNVDLRVYGQRHTKRDLQTLHNSVDPDQPLFDV